MRAILVALLFVAVGTANISVLAPVQLAFDKTIYTDFETQSHYMGNATIGRVAPGQTVYLVFDRETGDEFLWTNIQLDVPEGWTKDDSKNSTRDISSVTASFTLPKNITLGTYEVRASAQNDLGVRATESIGLSFEVVERVFTITPPADARVNAGDATPIHVSVSNIGVGSDVLVLGSISGLPARWTQGQYVPIGPLETRQVTITTSPLDEGLYVLGFQVRRASSPIVDENQFYLRVLPTLKAKFRAMSEGFDLIPMILQPIYSLLSFLGLA